MAFWRTVIRGNIQGEAMQITRFWATASASPDIQDFVNQFGEDFFLILEQLVADTVIMDDFYVANPAVGSLGNVYVPLTYPFAGLLASAVQLPRHDAVQLEFRSTAPDYPRIGFNRISGATEGQIEAGSLTSVAQTNWGAVASLFSTPYNASGTVWSPVLWSDTYQRANPMTSGVVDSRISTQKTRR